MKTVMGFNVLCILWLALCFYMNWEPWIQFAIIVPNMIGWTFFTLISG